MLNEDRIKLMTKMAAYEEKEGKRDIPICKYFRIDYVSLNIVKTAISTTIAFVLIVGMWLLYRADYFMENISKIDLVALGEEILKYYLIVMLIYIIIAYIVYMIKYNSAKRGVKRYYAQLKRISKLYDKENRK